MNYNLEDDGAHEELKAIEKTLRAAIDALSDARIYYAEDPSDRNLLLLRQAKVKVRQAENEKVELLESLGEGESNDLWT